MELGHCPNDSVIIDLFICEVKGVLQKRILLKTSSLFKWPLRRFNLIAEGVYKIRRTVLGDEKRAASTLKNPKVPHVLCR
jgi:hypothetical protein